MHVIAVQHSAQQFRFFFRRSGVPDISESLEVSDGEFVDGHLSRSHSLQLVLDDPNLPVKLHSLNHPLLVEFNDTFVATLKRMPKMSQVEQVVLGVRQLQRTLLPVSRQLEGFDNSLHLAVNYEDAPVTARRLAEDAARGAGFLIAVDALDVVAPRRFPAGIAPNQTFA